MLLQGYSVKSVAKATQRNPSTIHEYARRHHLPTNPPLRPKSRTYNSLIQCIRLGYETHQIAGLYSQAPCKIHRLRESLTPPADETCGS